MGRLRLVGIGVGVVLLAVIAALVVPLPNLTPATPTPCPLVWAQEAYPDLTLTYRERLQAANVPVTQVRVYGFGEAACGDMLPRQTDFDVTLAYDADAPPANLADWVETTLLTVTDAPVDETPGPNPGRVRIQLQSAVGGQTLMVQLAEVYAYTALDNPDEPLITALGLEDDLLFVD
jgi:hypothetical protein